MHRKPQDPASEARLRVREVTAQELLEGLKALGVEEGMGLMVHASLSSFGRVAGGALTVVQCLMHAVTERGTLLMPTFNHGAPYAPGGEGFFDPRSTPSISGAISEVFWRQPGVHRSLHPTHSFAAWGAGAEELVADHHQRSTLGPDSPLGKLTDRGGYMLHLGTTHGCSSVKHVAELMHGAACLADQSDSFAVHLPEGRRVELTSWRYRAESCPLTESGEHIEQRLVAQGLQRERRIGQSQVLFVSLRACREVTLDLLTRGVGAIPPCRACTIRPSSRREGDWG